MRYTIEFDLPDNDTVLNGIKSDYVHWSIWGYEGYEKAQPAADVVERKTGRWEYQSETFLKCSVCGKLNITSPHFCPNCGADMRGKE